MKTVLSGRGGFSLTEVMVVAGLMGIVAMGTASLISYNMKAQRGVSLKSEALSMGTQIRLMMSSSESCKKVFSLGTADAPDFIASALPATDSSAPLEVSLNSIVSDSFGKLLSTSAAISPGLNVHSIKLLILPPVQPNQHLANLRVTFKQNGSAMGSSIFTETFPLLITLATDAGDSSKKEMIDCWERSSAGGIGDPKQACSDLGGIWLEATQSGHQMPVPRCNMTQDIVLALNENPDHIPQNGMVASGPPNYIEGYRVSQCYYQTSGSALVTTYNCRTYTGNRAGDRCAWSPDRHRWEIVYYNSSGIQTSTIRRVCYKGVQVSTLSEGSTLLEFYENIDTISTFSLNADDSFAKKSDYLPTVARCNYHPTLDRWKDCSNAKDPAGSKAGKAGHCVYVKGIKLYHPDIATLVNAYNVNNNGGNASCTTTSSSPDSNGLTCINRLDYTGWIYVSGDTPRKAYVDALGKGRIREARGMPCFQVEVNVAGDVTGPYAEGVDVAPSSLTGTSYVDSSSPNYKHPRAVVECVHEALADAAEPAGKPSVRSTIFTCEDDFTYGNLTDLYLSSNWDDFEDQFPTGSCWHFTNAKIKGYQQASYNYAGWVYLKDKFKNTSSVMSPAYRIPNTTSTDSIEKRGGANPAPIPGVPCKLCDSAGSCGGASTTAGIRAQ